MARKRMIDPDFWTDEKLGSLKRDNRLLFMGLISNADDEGRGRSNPKLLKSTIFPYDEDLKSKDVENMLIDLSKLHLVILYRVDGQEFYCLPNFLKHQNINRPSESKLPQPTDENIVKQLTDDSVNIHGIIIPKRKEENIKEINSTCNELFEKLWILYPNKKGKGQVSETQKAKLYKVGFDELSRCIDRYKRTKENWKEWQQGSTFFNSGYVDYLDCNFSEERKEETGRYRRAE